MIEPASRYFNIGESVWITRDGERISYKLRRLPPEGSTMTIQTVVGVRPGDRLDLIADRTLGDAQLFWRIADANDAMNPFDLIEWASLRIPAVRP